MKLIIFSLISLIFTADYYLLIADINGDQALNVVDIVNVFNIIFEN
tara:strand:- start:136 stop:273 length:138 start_codon:yes stop_codon:yes gene_type:complete